MPLNKCEECQARMKKRQRYLVGGKLLCGKCRKDVMAVRSESERLAKLSEQLHEKRKLMSAEVRKEKSKR